MQAQMDKDQVNVGRSLLGEPRRLDEASQRQPRSYNGWPSVSSRLPTSFLHLLIST